MIWSIRLYTFIPGQNRLRLIVGAWSLKIFQGSVGVFSPQILQLGDLHCCDLSCTELLLFWGDLYQPWEEAAIVNQWKPLRGVPVHILAARHRGAWLTRVHERSIR